MLSGVLHCTARIKPIPRIRIVDNIQKLGNSDRVSNELVGLKKLRDTQQYEEPIVGR